MPRFVAQAFYLVGRPTSAESELGIEGHRARKRKRRKRREKMHGRRTNKDLCKDADPL